MQVQARGHMDRTLATNTSYKSPEEACRNANPLHKAKELASSILLPIADCVTNKTPKKKTIQQYEMRTHAPNAGGCIREIERSEQWV